MYDDGPFLSGKNEYADRRCRLTVYQLSGLVKKVGMEAISHKRYEQGACHEVIDDSRITLVPGGLPLIVDGKTVGAIGVGGGSKEQDMEIARHVVAKFESLMSE